MSSTSNHIIQNKNFSTSNELNLTDDQHVNTVYLSSSACVGPPLPGLYPTLVCLTVSVGSPMTQSSWEGGHRAQLNLWTKRCSSLMTQWDLPVRAWSMPAAVSADAQLTEKTLWPQQHKGSPASKFSQLQLFTSKASLFTATPYAFSGRQEKESQVVSQGTTDHIEPVCTLFWMMFGAAVLCASVLFFSWFWSISYTVNRYLNVTTYSYT